MVDLPRDWQVTRGKVYAKATGRYIGLLADVMADLEGGTKQTEDFVPGETGFSISSVEDDFATAPLASTLTKADLVEIAQEVGLVGYSAMTKADLIEGLAASGHVALDPE